MVRSFDTRLDVVVVEEEVHSLMLLLLEVNHHASVGGSRGSFAILNCAGDTLRLCYSLLSKARFHLSLGKAGNKLLIYITSRFVDCRLQ